MAVQVDPRVVGGRYFSGYWAHEYTVDVMFTTVDPFTDERGGFRWLRGTTWFWVTWIPSEDAVHPRVSGQWRGEGYHSGQHCTAWDRRDEVVCQPA
jgi:hypothetical protein